VAAATFAESTERSPATPVDGAFDSREEVFDLSGLCGLGTELFNLNTTMIILGRFEEDGRVFDELGVLNRKPYE
jgi:hypothetical protein